MDQEGWDISYATVGASLRSIPSEHWSSLSNCWVARHPSESHLESTQVPVVEAMLKFLRRGTAPPMHPKAEGSLLQQMGAKVGTPLSEDFAPPACGVADIARSLMDSDAERDLVEWMESLRQGVARWLVPQPSLDDLAGKPSDGDAWSGRYHRCDFLFSPPGLSPTVVEVDGGQHRKQKSVDASRDKELSAAGYETIRVPTSELRDGIGAGLDKLQVIIDHSQSTRPPAINPLVWAPVQTHRLMLGLCEAIAAGWLKNPVWNVRVRDLTGLAVSLIGHYLELLDAFDLMWGRGTVAPRIATFRCGDRVTEWRRMGPCAYQSYAGEPGADPHPDVEIRLDAEHLPVERLPESVDSRMVVIRSATITRPLPDNSPGPHGRLAPFVEASEEEALVALESILQGVFGKESFMKGQSEAIMEVLAGRDCVVLLPTGGGKSLIYQFAGLCLPGRTLVVDPLVALIEDQELALRGYGIDRVVGISHHNRDADFSDAYFVLVTPERLQRKDFRNVIRSWATVKPVNLAVIDEAHCVSEWGHDFRPAYLDFGKVLRDAGNGAMGAPPLLALTGTASRSVLSDTMFQLGIEATGENTLVRPTSLDRAELSYKVVIANPANAPSVLLSELRGLPGHFGVKERDFFNPTGRPDNTYSGIVFVPTVNGHHGVIETLQEVKKAKLSAVAYSGEAPREDRKEEWTEKKRRNSEEFKANEVLAMVATNAFGMGIDKPNIRWTIHYGLPSSIESFYQEAGRAGRDRRSAICTLVLTEFNPERNARWLSDKPPRKKPPFSERDDISTEMYFHTQSFPSREDETQLLLRMFDQLNGSSGKVPLREVGRESEAKRALHRLTTLGVVSSYHLEGGGGNEVADVSYAYPSDPEKVKNSLLDFVERSQPGRASAIREKLDNTCPDIRSAVDRCGGIFVDFIYDTIGAARLRSLREMRLVALEGKGSGGEAVRRRVLDYLTEGDVSSEVLELAEKSTFHFDDWIEKWEGIESALVSREWRSVTARLLGSYPEHPGLLVSRGLVETFLPEGDPEEAERNLEQGFRQARELYGADSGDIEGLVRWLLETLGNAGGSPDSALAKMATTYTHCLSAIVIGAARQSGVGVEVAEKWLEDNWGRSQQLAALQLIGRLGEARTLQATVITKYIGNGDQ